MVGQFINDDLRHFFELDEFAERARVVSGDLAGQPLRLIFDMPYSDPYGVAGNLPVAMVKSDAVRDMKVDDKIEVRGTTYRVRSVEPDGTGVTKLTFTELP